MLLHYLKTGFFLFTINVVAQTTPTDTLNKTVNIDSSKVVAKTIKITDAISKDSLPIVLNYLKNNIKNDSAFHYSKKIDSLWLKELYNNDLYSSMNKFRVSAVNNPVYYPELSKDTLIARLEALNKKTPFHIEYNPILESVIKGFLKNRKRSFQRLMALSNYYFPHFEKELDAHDMPLELKYLAIVESALNPRAKSRVGATGLWQFMYGTGKEHGLNVSSYVDERSDLDKSTKAACEYLTRVYKIFGDWDLALASYNSGPGNVSKAIRRSGGHQNYWNIRPFLPRETAGYVPLFQATMYMFEYAEAHNLVGNTPKHQYFEVDTIRVRKKIALEHVSDLLNIAMEDLRFMNPSYKLDIIPADKTENYLLRLPKTHIGKFIAYETEIYAYASLEFNKREKPLPELVKASSRIRYRVKSGDFLGKIARKYGVKVSQIKRWNGLKTSNLKIGQRLVIFPRHPHRVVNTKLPPKTKKTVKTKFSTAGRYTVKPGDTLYDIAKHYTGISATNIKEHNNLKSSSLKPGMVLQIPKS